GGLEDKNFLGLGHDFHNNFHSNNANGKKTFNTTYLIPNIRNTYITTTFHYDKDENNNFNRNFSMDRPFFSAFAKWAGGIYQGQTFRRDSIKAKDYSTILQRFRI